MRIQIRNALNVDAPVNLRKLSPYMKVYAGVVSKYHDSNFYKLKRNRKLEAANIQRIQQDESLKEIILAKIIRELNDSLSMKEKGKVCDSMVLSIAASHKKSFDRVRNSSEFLSYNFEDVEEDSDIRLAFKEMPYLVRVTKKVL